MIIYLLDGVIILVRRHLLNICLIVIITSGLGYAQIPTRVTKSACLPTYKEEAQALKQKLLTIVKREAVNELFGERITILTEVRNFALTRDEIESRSRGFVRIDGDPEYYAKGFGEGCVRINAYATAEDFAQFEPKPISKEVCESEGDVETIQKRTEEKAKLEVLLDYNAGLRGQKKDHILRLFHQVKYSNSRFISGTSYYCIVVSGIVYPIEIMKALGSMEAKRAVPPIDPAQEKVAAVGMVQKECGRDNHISLPKSGAEVPDQVTIEGFADTQSGYHLWLVFSRKLQDKKIYYDTQSVIVNKKNKWKNTVKLIGGEQEDKHSIELILSSEEIGIKYGRLSTRSYTICHKIEVYRER